MVEERTGEVFGMNKVTEESPVVIGKVGAISEKFDMHLEKNTRCRQASNEKRPLDRKGIEEGFDFKEIWGKAHVRHLLATFQQLSRFIDQKSKTAQFTSNKMSI